MMPEHLPGVHLPAWDLRGCTLGARSAIIASQIREQVFLRLKEHSPDLSCLTLSKLALIYDQARWWIAHQHEAEACLSRLLFLQRREALSRMWHHHQGEQERRRAISEGGEEEGGSSCTLEAD